MATKVQVNPLIDIRNTDFAQAYEQGLWWCVCGDREGDTPLDDTYLVDNLKTFAGHGYFDGKHDHCFPHIGFCIGLLHGGVLVPDTLQVRDDVTTLVVLRDEWTTRGYRAGREWFFYEAEPQQRRRTDSDFMKRLSESITEMLSFNDDADTWNFSIGCVLGELSGQLFPQTKQEYEHWEETKQHFEEHC